MQHGTRVQHGKRVQQGTREQQGKRVQQGTSVWPGYPLLPRTYEPHPYKSRTRGLKRLAPQTLKTAVKTVVKEKLNATGQKEATRPERNKLSETGGPQPHRAATSAVAAEALLREHVRLRSKGC